MPRHGTWDLDFAGDFELADGWEPVTVVRRTAADTYQHLASGVRALREQPTRLAAADLIEQVETVWHLRADASYDPPAVAAGAVVLTAGGIVVVAGPGWDGDLRRDDLLLDGSGVWWEIRRADLAGALDQWRLGTVRMHR